MKCTESQDRNWTREAPYILQKQLIDDNFTRYQSAISKIFLDAKAEFNIEKEIEKIQ